MTQQRIFYSGGKFYEWWTGVEVTPPKHKQFVTDIAAGANFDTEINKDGEREWRFQGWYRQPLCNAKPI